MTTITDATHADGLLQYHHKTVLVWRFDHVVGALILAGLVLAVFHNPWWNPAIFWLEPLLLGLIVLNSIIKVAILIPLRYRNSGYLLDDETLLLARGKLWRSLTLVRRDKILYVTTKTGPLLRRWNVVELNVGILGEKFTIPAVTPDEAQRLKIELALSSPWETPEQGDDETH